KYPEVEFVLNSESNRLSYWAPDSDIERIQGDISRLTAAMPQLQERSLLFYQPKTALSSEMLSTLTTLVPEATISLAAEGKQLSVVATDQEHLLVAATLKQMEAIEEPTDRMLKLYPATELQKNRLEAFTASLPDELTDLTILPDPVTPEIAVWGSAEQHLLFADLLETLKSTTHNEVVEPERVELAVADTTGLLETLQGKYPTTDFVLNDQAGVLYYWAQPELLQQVQAEIQKLLLAMPKREDKRLETYEINPKDSANLISVLQSLSTTATFTVDPSSRWLMVVGTERDHEVTQSVVEKMIDREGADDTVLIAYPVSEGDAESIVSLLGEMKPDLTIVADTRSNRVLAAAPLSEQPRLQALISQLDAAPDDREQVVVESYPLAASDPKSVLEVLQPLFPEMQVSVDETNRQLIASGTKIQQERFAMTIKRVDRRDQEQAASVAVYSVGEAAVDQVQNVLMQLVPTAVISTNPESKQVLVWTDEQSHKVISDAIKQFTQADPEEMRSLRTYQVDGGLVDSIVAILGPALPDAKLSTNAKSLIAWATEDEHTKIQSSLKVLAETLSESDEKTVKVITESPQVLNLAKQLLADLAPEVTLLDISTDDRWVVWTNEDGHQGLAKILNSLAEQVTGEVLDQTIVVYDLG
ncbi:MAG: secretin N-terminal domain-containing protein, partial [Rubripirellula sp.]